MPELAEVEFERRRWDEAIGRRVLAVEVNPRAQVFRGFDARELVPALTGARLLSSEAKGKQMCFRFERGTWIGLHLGMSGSLRVEAKDFRGETHDHLILRLRDRALVFRDPRRFGRVRFERTKEEPTWWASLPLEVLSPRFTVEHVTAFLTRRGRSPIKAVLLMQAAFPGVGNWMADEILWRAEIHPARAAGSLSSAELRRLHRELRFVSRGALRSVGRHGGDLPRGWLFWERWRDGGACPATGVALVRETIGGRTTCWSPGRQALPVVKK